jgi:SAM-dependent methyltransferase
MRDRNLIERRYAEFYDLHVGGFSRDIPIYLELAAKYPGPILEVGCATGRVLESLAGAGHEVHGIDTQRPMLDIARKRIQPWRERARASDHDLRNAALPGAYNGAIVSLHAFNGLIEIEEQRLFLRHLGRSLSAPAIAVLDCFCPLSLVRPEESGEWREFTRAHNGREVVVRDLREMLTPLLERRTQVFRIDGGPETEAVTHRRYVPPTQLGALLEEAGFDSVRWVQNYDLQTMRPVEPDGVAPCPYLIFAEK